MALGHVAVPPDSPTRWGVGGETDEPIGLVRTLTFNC